MSSKEAVAGGAGDVVGRFVVVVLEILNLLEPKFVTWSLVMIHRHN